MMSTVHVRRDDFMGSRFRKYFKKARDLHKKARIFPMNATVGWGMGRCWGRFAVDGGVYIYTVNIYKYNISKFIYRK